MLGCRKPAMGEACADFSAELRELKGEDHLHLLVEYPPKIAISTLVNLIKGLSAR